MRDIFRYLLKRTYEEMRELNMIEDKMTKGSPRTIKLFEKFLVSNFQQQTRNPVKLQKSKKVTKQEEMQQYMREYGFIRRLVDDGQELQVSQDMLKKLYYEEGVVPTIGPARPADITQSFDELTRKEMQD